MTFLNRPMVSINVHDSIFSKIGLQIKCKNEGCDFIDLTQIENHQNQCQKCPDCKVRCRWCYGLFAVSDLPEHEGNCSCNMTHSINSIVNFPALNVDRDWDFFGQNQPFNDDLEIMDDRLVFFEQRELMDDGLDF